MRLFAALSLLLLLNLVGCAGGGGDGGAAAVPTVSGPGGPATLKLEFVDVDDRPIADADVTLSAGGSVLSAKTNADGAVTFTDLRAGEATLTVSPEGFEPWEWTLSVPNGTQEETVILTAENAWAVGRAIVLGTHVLDRAADGSTLTFSVDVAVIGEDAIALETLTGDGFSIPGYDCGWGGPRDCASDSLGNSTGSLQPDSDAEAFELVPSSVEHPYIVSVLAERSDIISDWDHRGPALKSFFASLDGNGVVQLASVQTQSGSTALTLFGPFTSDGGSYLEAIDSLAAPASDPPAMRDALMASIQRTALADDGGLPGTQRTVLVLTTQGLNPAEMDSIAALSAETGVRVSTVYQSASSWYGFSEVSMRTGGFVADFQDPRQLGMIFGAMTRLLSGTPPHYRMQFRLRGGAGTFVSGGNVKTGLHVRIPSAIPNQGAYTAIDVAIP